MPTLEQHILNDLYELECAVKQTLIKEDLHREILLLEETIKKLEYFIINNETKTGGI